jgi:predicted O-linked N-acetylglucosamine transferase (SPINDLY family)
MSADNQRGVASEHEDPREAMQQLLLHPLVRPISEYHRDELPSAAPAKLGADMRDRLLGPMTSLATLCRIDRCGAEFWYEVFTLCYQLLVRARVTEALEIADRFAGQIDAVLASSLSLGDRLCVYDMFKNLFFMAGKDFAEYRRFDAHVVKPYSAWLRTLADPAGSAAPRRTPARGRRLRVGYLCNHAAMMAPGRPAAPLFVSMILDHHAHLDHECIVYAVGEPDPAWRAFLARDGVAVASLPFTGYPARGDCDFPRALEMIRNDTLDMLLTDDNVAMPLYLFEHRVAPVQVYVAMGMAFWSIRHLDHILTGPVSVESSGSDLPPERLLPGRICYHPRLLDQPAGPAGAALRARIPADHRIAGVFARFVKLSAAYLDAVGRILSENPRLSLIIAGNGDPSLIRRAIEGSAAADRVILFEHDVDIFTYGPVIDFFLDSFPFPSGNSTREIQYFGKPVVSRQVEDFALFFQQSRDPELVAADLDAYVGIAGRLARDPDYLAARSAVARDIGALDVRRGGNVELLRTLIARSMKDLSVPAADSAASA